ncbi:unnamed protein product, partial [marine sediment metagenome]
KGKMKVLRIPDEEKAKGMMWVIYPITREGFKIIGFTELQIKQGKN